MTGGIVAGGAATPGSYSGWRGRAPDERRDQSPLSASPSGDARRAPREQFYGAAIEASSHAATRHRKGPDGAPGMVSSGLLVNVAPPRHG